MDTKRRKKRILRKIVIGEISAVDRPAQEGCLVTIMKRASPASESFERRQAMLEHADELLSKFNHSHDERGRFSSGTGGGSTSTSSTSSPSDGSGTITQAHKDETLRWIQIAARTAKIASWALVVPAMVAAFTAAAPVSATFAVGAALATLVSRAALTRAAAFIAFDQGLSALIRHRESELSKAAPEDDPILRTLLALKQELQAFKPSDASTSKYNHQHDQRGRFASGSGSAGGSTGTNVPAVVTPESRSKVRRVIASIKAGAGKVGRAAVTVKKIATYSLMAAVAVVAVAEEIQRIQAAVSRGAPPSQVFSPLNLSPEQRAALDRLQGTPAWVRFVRQMTGAYRRKKPSTKPHQGNGHFGGKWPPSKKQAPTPELPEDVAAMLLEALPDLLPPDEADALAQAFNTETTKMDDLDKHDDDYEDLVKAEIGRSGMPRYIAEQRILAKYGNRPNASAINKAREAGTEFTKVVDDLKASGLSGTQALSKARQLYPDEFERFQDS